MIAREKRGGEDGGGQAGGTRMEIGCAWGNGRPRPCADDFSVELYT